MPSADEIFRGQVNLCGKVRCQHCRIQHLMETDYEAIDKDLAKAWAEQDGFVYFDDIGWLCPTCTQHVFDQRRRRKKGIP